MKILTFPLIPHEDFYPIGENLDVAFEYIDKVSTIIKNIISFEMVINIWCSGSSGAILAALLAKSIPNKCIICHVKKEGETSHHGNKFYCASSCNKNIIIDDFSRSGETLSRIHTSIDINTTIEYIDVLILYDRFKGDWKLPFVPEYFIVNEESVDNRWKSLKLGNYESAVC